MKIKIWWGCCWDIILTNTRYMKKNERMKPGFLRPKTWFKGKEFKCTKKVKILGLTCSNGSSWAVQCPRPFTQKEFAKIVTTKMGPWLKEQFPDKDTIQILMDGEKLLRAPASKKALEDQGIKLLPNWPSYSPDLNPQENVWSWAEESLEFEKSRVRCVCQDNGCKKQINAHS